METPEEGLTWARIPGPSSATAPWWEGKAAGVQKSPSSRSPGALHALPSLASALGQGPCLGLLEVPVSPLL